MQLNFSAGTSVIDFINQTISETECYFVVLNLLNTYQLTFVKNKKCYLIISQIMLNMVIKQQITKKSYRSSNMYIQYVYSSRPAPAVLGVLSKAFVVNYYERMNCCNGINLPNHDILRKNIFQYQR